MKLNYIHVTEKILLLILKSSPITISQYFHLALADTATIHTSSNAD
jgi:hypothetical protein